MQIKNKAILKLYKISKNYISFQKKTESNKELSQATLQTTCFWLYPDTMSQQHKSISQKESVPSLTLTNFDNSTLLKHKLKKKLNYIFNRVHDQAKVYITGSKKQMNIITQTKGKVERKDTLQTKQTLADSNQSVLPIPNDDKMDEMIKKSEKNPFLKIKLKTILENDLKGLMKLNQRNPVSETALTQSVGDLRTSLKSLNSSEVIDTEYKHIPKDISIILNQSVLLRRSDPGKTTQRGKSSSLHEHIFQDFTNEQQNVLINNQHALKQQFTTLRKEAYKSKVARLQSLRSIQEKQLAITQMALSRFVDEVKLKNSGHIKRNNTIRQISPQRLQ